MSIDDMDEEEEEATVEARLLVSPVTSISERKKKDLFEIDRERERRTSKALANGYIVRVYIYTSSQVHTNGNMYVQYLL